ncbi:MAG TPA: 4,5-DOPA dioxygenase extradiol [Verrucomicrobiae bacterium]|nr:4,5-DOPA dioxygenase extradiol [Verrucomicrobiae bacterium]
MIMPVIFVGHGNPMNAVSDSPFSAAWAELGHRLPAPSAILSVSAHWETDGTRVTTMERPRTIHDFYGFPEELYRVQYPAPGSRDLAERVRRLVPEVMEDAGWGLDHGTWAVLCRMYPAADVPVVQLSLNRRLSPAAHVSLARRLAPLRDEGVLIVGSGNIVHNLGVMQWGEAKPYPWAEEFDRLSAELILAGDLDVLCDYQNLGEAARLSIPTNEHYLPLLYALALRRPDDAVAFFAEEIVLASVSMRGVRIG